MRKSSGANSQTTSQEIEDCSYRVGTYVHLNSAGAYIKEPASLMNL